MAHPCAGTSRSSSSRSSSPASASGSASGSSTACTGAATSTRCSPRGGRAPPVDLASATDPASLPYAQSTATGTYDPAHEIILSGRSSRTSRGQPRAHAARARGRLGRAGGSRLGPARLALAARDRGRRGARPGRCTVAGSRSRPTRSRRAPSPPHPPIVDTDRPREDATCPYRLVARLPVAAARRTRRRPGCPPGATPDAATRVRTCPTRSSGSRSRRSRSSAASCCSRRDRRSTGIATASPSRSRTMPAITPADVTTLVRLDPAEGAPTRPCQHDRRRAVVPRRRGVPGPARDRRHRPERAPTRS